MKLTPSWSMVSMLELDIVVVCCCLWLVRLGLRVVGSLQDLYYNRVNWLKGIGYRLQWGCRWRWGRLNSGGRVVRDLRSIDRQLVKKVFFNCVNICCGVIGIKVCCSETNV